MLSKIEDEDQRILVKQWLFFKYEKELKRQNKDAPKPAKKVIYRLLTFARWKTSFVPRMKVTAIADSGARTVTAAT